MPRQFWSEAIAWATASGTAVASTATETILIPNVTIAANYMQDGRVLRMTSGGVLSNTASATMIWAIRWGGVAGTLLATTEAVTPGAAVTNLNWRLVVELQTRTNGSAGTIICNGLIHVSLTTTTSFDQVFGVSGFDAMAPVTVDLTADTALALTGKWSASSASNTITCHTQLIETLN